MTNLNQYGKEEKAKGGSMKWLGAHLPEVIAISMMAVFSLVVVSCSKKEEKPAAIEYSMPAQNTASAAPAATPAPTPALKKVKKVRPTTATYVSSDNGLSVTYPRKYGIKLGKDAQMTWPGLGPVPMGFGRDGGSAVAAIQLPGNLYKDTDFAAAFLSINVNREIGQEACEQFTSAKPDYTVQTASVKLGGNEYRRVETVTSDHMKQGDAKYYHTYQNNRCYEFALGVATSRDGEDDSTPQVDRTDVFRKLEKVMTTVHIKQLQPTSTEQPADSKAETAPAGGVSAEVGSDKL